VRWQERVIERLMSRLPSAWHLRVHAAAAWMRSVWRSLSARLEFVPRDLWVGVYFKRVRVRTWPPGGCVEHTRVDVWLAPLPMVPLHVSAEGPARPVLATPPYPDVEPNLSLDTLPEKGTVPLPV